MGDKNRLIYSDVKSVEYSSFLDWERKFENQNPQCIWCKVHCELHEDNQLTKYPNGAIENYITTIYECPTCGWWSAKQKLEELMIGVNAGEKMFMRGGRKKVSAILKNLDLSAPEIPIAELRNHLTKNFDDIRHIAPQKMEELARSIFAQHLNCKIHYFTNSTFAPDGGIDLIAVESETGIETAIQVKRRASKVSESVVTIREFIGSMALEGYQNGIFVTTGEFSRPAQKIPDRLTNVFGIKAKLTLINSRRFQDILLQTNNTSAKISSWMEKLDRYRHSDVIDFKDIL